MAGKPDIWMPLYIDDWDRDTSHLDCEQDGAYGRLVRQYWKTGPLHDDDAMLARTVRMERSRWRKVRPVVAAFFEIRDGRWFHKRVEEEIGRALEVAEKRRQAGRGGGRPRKQTVSQNESPALANQKQNETHAGVAVDVDVDSSEIANQLSKPTQEIDISSEDSSQTAKIIPMGGRNGR